MLGAGAAIVAGFAVATKAAISWESAFAGVRKTVEETTNTSFADLEAGLRTLARSLPATHEEIAAVASAAGQLGVSADDVVAFTRTMINLGEATNLTSEEAASALARLSNIMGTSTADVDRFGAALVDLGNNSATTEAEIVDMALRIAGAGATIGLTEGEVLGFAAALSSVGIEAAAGGTAISRVFVTIEQAVRAGGDDLAEFARIAGMSAGDFARAYGEDAGGAISAFIAGLGDVQASGEDVFATLNDLELGEIRVRDALLRASSAGDLLADSLGRGNDAWAENSALVAEAAARYETTEAQIAIARNALSDVAITMGQELLPIVGDMARDVSALIGLFQDLPEPVQDSLTKIGLAVAAVGLLGGAALIATPRLAAMNATLAASGPAGAAAAGFFSRVTTLLRGPWGIALAAAGALIGGITQNVADMRQASRDAADAISADAGTIGATTQQYIATTLAQRDMIEAAEQLGVSLEDTVIPAILGNEAAQQRLNRAIEEALNPQELQDNYVMAATESMWEQADAAQNLQVGVDRLRGDIESGLGAYRDNADVAEAVAESMGTLEQAAVDVGEVISDLQARIRDLTTDTFSVEAAQDSFTSSLADFEEQVRANIEAEEDGARSLEGNTEAALANREALRDLVAEGGNVIATMLEQGATTDEIADATDSLRQRIEDTAGELGLSREETERYTESLDELPREIVQEFLANGLTEALNTLARLEEVSGRVDGRTITLNVRDSVRLSTTGGSLVAQADGGIWQGGRLTQAANGLIRDPMIAPAGANILWAEPETGGESYIPHAPSKRARALELWAETGAILGVGAPTGGGGGLVQANLVVDGRQLASVLIDPLSGEVAQQTRQSGGRAPWE